MLIFQHIPKAAGTALVDSLISLYSPRQVAFCYDHAKRRRLEGLSDRSRRALRLVCGHHALDLDSVWGVSAKYYTMLRDPRRHFVSMYHYKQRQGEEPYRSLPFAEFFAQLRGGRINIDDFGHMIDNIQVRYLNREFLRCSMDPTRNAHHLDPDVADANEFLDNRCCAVGITEKYEESLGILGGLLGASLPLLYSNARPGPKLELPSELAGFLGEYHHLDIRLYEHGLQRLKADLSRFEKRAPHAANTALHRWRARAYRVAESVFVR